MPRATVIGVICHQYILLVFEVRSLFCLFISLCCHFETGGLPWLFLSCSSPVIKSTKYRKPKFVHEIDLPESSTYYFFSFGCLLTFLQPNLHGSYLAGGEIASGAFNERNFANSCPLKRHAKEKKTTQLMSQFHLTHIPSRKYV